MGFFGGPRHERSGGFGRRNQHYHDPYDHHDPYHDRHSRRGIGHGVRFFGPIRFRFFGFNVYVSSGKQIGFIAGLFALFIMAISIFGMFSGYKNCKATIEEYDNKVLALEQEKAGYNQEIAGLDKKFEEYVEIISKARDKKDDDYYISTGIFYDNYAYLLNYPNYAYEKGYENRINKVVSDGKTYYEIIFVISELSEGDDSLSEELLYILSSTGEESGFLNFTTYAMYDSLFLEQSFNLSSSPLAVMDIQYMQVAFSYIDGEVKAINTSFDKTKAIEGETKYYNSLISIVDSEIVNLDSEYDIENVKSKLKTHKVAIGILFGVVAIIVLIIILLIVKVIKKSKQQAKLDFAMKEAEVQEAQARAQEAQTRAEIVQEELNKKNLYCDYCGAKIHEGDRKCPSCGSVIFEVKK